MLGKRIILKDSWTGGGEGGRETSRKRKQSFEARVGGGEIFHLLVFKSKQ